MPKVGALDDSSPRAAPTRVPAPAAGEAAVAAFVKNEMGAFDSDTAAGRAKDGPANSKRSPPSSARSRSGDVAPANEPCCPNCVECDDPVSSFLWPSFSFLLLPFAAIFLLGSTIPYFFTRSNFSSPTGAIKTCVKFILSLIYVSFYGLMLPAMPFRVVDLWHYATVEPWRCYRVLDHVWPNKKTSWLAPYHHVLMIVFFWLSFHRVPWLYCILRKRLQAMGAPIAERRALMLRFGLAEEWLQEYVTTRTGRKNSDNMDVPVAMMLPSNAFFLCWSDLFYFSPFPYTARFIGSSTLLEFGHTIVSVLGLPGITMLIILNVTPCPAGSSHVRGCWAPWITVVLEVTLLIGLVINILRPTILGGRCNWRRRMHGARALAFNWFNHENWLVVVSLGVEVFQLNSFAFQHIVPWHESAAGLTNAFQVSVLGYTGNVFVPALGVAAGVAFLWQILLGLGPCMKSAGCVTSNPLAPLQPIIVLISDVFFLQIFLICTRVFDCTRTAPPLLRAYPSIVCWESDHMVLVTVAAVALTLFCFTGIIVSPHSLMDVEQPETVDIKFSDFFRALDHLAKAFLAGALLLLPNLSLAAYLAVTSGFLFIGAALVYKLEPSNYDSANVVRLVAYTSAGYSSLCALMATVMQDYGIAGATNWIPLALVIVGWCLMFVAAVWRLKVGTSLRQHTPEALMAQLHARSAAELAARLAESSSILPVLRAIQRGLTSTHSDPESIRLLVESGLVLRVLNLAGYDPKPTFTGEYEESRGCCAPVENKVARAKRRLCSPCYKQYGLVTAAQREQVVTLRAALEPDRAEFDRLALSIFDRLDSDELEETARKRAEAKRKDEWIPVEPMTFGDVLHVTHPDLRGHLSETLAHDFDPSLALHRLAAHCIGFNVGGLIPAVNAKEKEFDKWVAGAQIQSPDEGKGLTDLAQHLQDMPLEEQARALMRAIATLPTSSSEREKQSVLLLHLAVLLASPVGRDLRSTDHDLHSALRQWLYWCEQREKKAGNDSMKIWSATFERTAIDYVPLSSVPCAFIADEATSEIAVVGSDIDGVARVRRALLSKQTSRSSLPLSAADAEVAAAWSVWCERMGFKDAGEDQSAKDQLLKDHWRSPQSVRVMLESTQEGSAHHAYWLEWKYASLGQSSKTSYLSYAESCHVAATASQDEPPPNPDAPNCFVYVASLTTYVSPKIFEEALEDWKRFLSKSSLDVPVLLFLSGVELVAFARHVIPPSDSSGEANSLHDAIACLQNRFLECASSGRHVVLVKNGDVTNVNGVREAVGCLQSACQLLKANSRSAATEFHEHLTPLNTPLPAGRDDSGVSPSRDEDSNGGASPQGIHRSSRYHVTDSRDHSNNTHARDARRKEDHSEEEEDEHRRERERRQPRRASDLRDGSASGDDS